VCATHDSTYGYVYVIQGGASLGFSTFRLALSQDQTSTMLQPKDAQSKSKGNDDDRVAVALQQYNDTKGHFSLVRWARTLSLVLGADRDPEIFDSPTS
jgi:hypothetical protein